MKTKIGYILISLMLAMISCSSQKKQIFIVSGKENQEAGKELALCLSKTYSDLAFQCSDKNIEGEKNIVLKTLFAGMIISPEN